MLAIGTLNNECFAADPILAQEADAAPAQAEAAVVGLGFLAFVIPIFGILGIVFTVW